MPTIAITRSILDAGVASLREDYDLRMPDKAPASFSEDELIDYARDAVALVPTVGDPVTARFFDANPQLRVVAQYAVGYDNIDLEAARKHNVVVTNTPGVLSDATADLAMALLLAVTRRIREADRFVREGQFEQWGARLMLGIGLSGKRMGIVGLGRIGAAIARRAKGFGMEVVYHNRGMANPTTTRLLSARKVPLNELLETSDVISLNCPLNENSYHLIDGEALERMKPTAVLVNTARGAVIDEAALVGALRSGEIAGAGLDVFEDEPNVHPGLLELDQVVFTPHVGSATVETRTRMGQMCAEAIRAVLNDEEKIPYRIA